MKHGCTLEIVREISTDLSHYNRIKVKLLSRVRLLAISWTAAYKAPPSMGFSRQEYWSGVPLPSPSQPPRDSSNFSPKGEILEKGREHGPINVCLKNWALLLPLDGQDLPSVQFSSVQSLCRVRLFATP